MANKKRIAAVILAVLVLLAVAVSLFVVAFEATHDCTGEDCRICAIVAVCHSTLKALSDASAIVAVAAALVFCGAALTAARKSAVYSATPISLKVKLLN